MAAANTFDVVAGEPGTTQGIMVIDPPRQSGANSIAHLPYLDALRGWAAVAVLTLHVGQRVFGLSGPLLWLTGRGGVGVPLFFVLSAMTLLLSMHVRQEERHRTLNFFIRRFFRIAPLFYCMIVFYVGRDGLNPRLWVAYDAPPATLSAVAASFAFMHGCSPYWINEIVPGGWSVGVEMTFYFLLPLLFCLIRGPAAAAGLLIAAVALTEAWIAWAGRNCPISNAEIWGHFVQFAFLTQLPLFATGILIYFFVLDRDRRPPWLTTQRAGAGLLLLLIALVSAQAVVQPRNDLGLILPIECALFILGLHARPTRVIVNPVSRWLGKISYSLYLTQFAVIPWSEELARAVMSLGWPAPLRLLIQWSLGVGLTAAVSAVTYRWIERPGQEMGRRLISWLDARRRPQLRTGSRSPRANAAPGR